MARCGHHSCLFFFGTLLPRPTPAHSTGSAARRIHPPIWRPKCRNPTFYISVLRPFQCGDFFLAYVCRQNIGILYMHKHILYAQEENKKVLPKIDIYIYIFCFFACIALDSYAFFLFIEKPAGSGLPLFRFWAVCSSCARNRFINLHVVRHISRGVHKDSNSGLPKIILRVYTNIQAR